MVYDNTDEENYVHQVFKLAKSKNARIHLLKKDSVPVGFVALSAKPFSEVPSVKIEYLFTSSLYRKIVFQELGDRPLRISEYLLGHAISITDGASRLIPLRYLSLQLANDRLEHFYVHYGFTRVEGTDWMSIVLPLD